MDTETQAYLEQYMPDIDRRNEAIYKLAKSIARAPLVDEESINQIVKIGYKVPVGLNQFSRKVKPIRDSLTPDETLILKMIGEGFSDVAIARKLQISYNTIRLRMKALYLITGAKNKFELHDLGKELCQNTQK
jgi:DNA-binding NarL/FixJ family response regulator